MLYRAPSSAGLLQRLRRHSLKPVSMLWKRKQQRPTSSGWFFICLAVTLLCYIIDSRLGAPLSSSLGSRSQYPGIGSLSSQQTALQPAVQQQPSSSFTVESLIYIHHLPTDCNTEACVAGQGLDWGGSFKISAICESRIRLTIRPVSPTGEVYTLNADFTHDAVQNHKWLHLTLVVDSRHTEIRAYFNGFQSDQLFKHSAIRYPLHQAQNLPFVVERCAATDARSLQVEVAHMHVWPLAVTTYELMKHLQSHDATIIRNEIAVRPLVEHTATVDARLPYNRETTLANLLSLRQPVTKSLVSSASAGYYDLVLLLSEATRDPLESTLAVIEQICTNNHKFPVSIWIVETEPRLLHSADLSELVQHQISSICSKLATTAPDSYVACKDVSTQWLRYNEFRADMHVDVVENNDEQGSLECHMLNHILDLSSRSDQRANAKHHLLLVDVSSLPVSNMVDELWANRGNSSVVIPRLLYPSGDLRDAGYHFRSVPNITSSNLLPQNRLRGVPLNYAASLLPVYVPTYEGKVALVDVARLLLAGKFRPGLEPNYHHAELGLRLQRISAPHHDCVSSEEIDVRDHHSRVKSDHCTTDAVLYLPSATAIYNSLAATEVRSTTTEEPFMASRAREEFSRVASRHLSKVRLPRVSSELAVKWHMHCGGSMGYETTMFLSELEPLVSLRTYPQRYGRCEHLDTISSLPAFYKDSLQRTRLSNVIENVIVYHRDYRTFGQYVHSPSTSYLIGRYMFEADGLHQQWIQHSNQLDEIWLPTKFHIDLWRSQGVDASKLHLVPEAIDVHLFDPAIVQPLYLPPPLQLPASKAGERTWRFLSVFKLEARKGWRELVEAYYREFTADDNVQLVLHTYLYNFDGDQWDAGRILGHINDYAKEHKFYRSDGSLPDIHIIGRRLTNGQLRSLYRSVDCYVQPSYAEGWGLPFTEAMSMTLPVVATNWSGPTEFLTDTEGYLIPVKELIPSDKHDEWLGGFRWAQPSIEQLQTILRHIYTHQDEADRKGVAARESIVQKYSTKKLADIIAKQFKRIELKTHASSSRSVQPKHFDESAKWVSVPGDVTICEHVQPSQTSPADQRGRRATSAATRVAILSSYPPTKCGIAEYTSSLITGMLQSPTAVAGDLSIEVIATVPDLYHLTDIAADAHHALTGVLIADPATASNLPPHTPQRSITDVPVTMLLRSRNVADFFKAAAYLNEHVDVLIVQHEFGLYGGSAGSYFLCFLRALQIPVITNTHTLHEWLSNDAQHILYEISQHSRHMLAMTALGVRYLDMFHAVRPQSADEFSITQHRAAAIHRVPHGVVGKTYADNSELKQARGWQSRIVALSVGLMQSEKGFDMMLEALPDVIAVTPSILFVIAGQPHPRCGDDCIRYKQRLGDMVRHLNLQQHVLFIEQYLSNEELHSLLRTCDMYVSLYTHSHVSSSGTVSSAMSHGKPVIATPYIYTKEVLANDRGIVVPFNSPADVAKAAIRLATSSTLRDQMGHAAFAYTREMTWDKVGQRYIDLVMESL